MILPVVVSGSSVTNSTSRGYSWAASRVFTWVARSAFSASVGVTSGGYRIGPGEIEECLMGHPAVAMVGVVGIPDPIRTEIVKAFVQLRPEAAASEALKADLASYVKTRLAAHEYPREVEFVAELPLTTTGKIMRRELRRIDAEQKGAAR